MKSIEPEEFFKKIAINSGVNDLQTVKDIFYGMIRTISIELRERHIVNLPDWGEFYIHIHSARRALDVNTMQPKTIVAQPTVKFSPDWKVKKHFKMLSDDTGTVI